MLSKKLIIAFIAGIILFIFPVTKNSEQPKESKEYQVIPDDAIRLRILANSDGQADQDVKRLVRDEVSEQISTWVEDIADIDEARQLIRSQIPEINSITKNVLEKENKNYQLDVTYGSNVTFPLKKYDSYIYPAGDYEAVLITLGEGQGANWWCVLFPPLCFLDFDNGTTVVDGDAEELDEDVEEEDEDEVKVKFFLFDWFGWT